MKRFLFLLLLGHGLLLSFRLPAQPLAEKLSQALQHFLLDTQLKQASIGFWVEDAETGQTVLEYDSGRGLAPASTQKIFTAIASFDLLGEQYRYPTRVGYSGRVVSGILKGDLQVEGSGDPTLGSWRFAQNLGPVFLKYLVASLENAGIRKIEGNIILDDSRLPSQPLPGGWIWEDIGNYYGAGSWGINWHENQYDLVVQPGEKSGDPVKFLAVRPDPGVPLFNQLTTGPAGSGDNGYIYLPPYGKAGFVEGTEAASSHPFTLSGSLPDPVRTFGTQLVRVLQTARIPVTGKILTGHELQVASQPIPAVTHTLYTHYSPTLDSIIYWFLRKSINLYGEVLAKTLGLQAGHPGTTPAGVEQIRKYWQQKGIDASSLNIWDGCGLSPQNRVTAKAEVTALAYARNQPWFPAFYQALPLIHGIKMKSGIINGSRAFTGYQISGSGRQYIFSLIVNDFYGDPQTLVEKMFQLLDLLK